MLPLVWLGLSAALALGTPVTAATYTWTGASGNAWSINSNWLGNVAPPASGLTVADLVFTDSNGGLFPNINGPYAIRSLTFTATARSFVFDTGPLTLGAGGLIQNSMNPQFFGAPVILGDSQTWRLANGAGALTFGGGVNTTSAGSSRFLTIYADTTTGSGNTVNGVISGGGTVYKMGAGILTLTGANTYTGATRVSAGTLAIGTGGRIAGGQVSVSAGATLAISGTGSVSTGADSTLSLHGGGSEIPASLTLTSDGNLSTGVAFVGETGVGNVEQSGGTFTTNGKSMYFGLYRTGRGYYTLTGMGSVSTGEVLVGYVGTGIFVQSGGTFDTGGKKIALGVDPGSRGSFTLSGTGTLSTGLADVGGRGLGSFAQSGGSFTTNGNRLSVGVSQGSSGHFELSGAGTLSTGAAYIGDNGSGTFVQTGGTFTTNGSELYIGSPSHAVEDSGSSGSYTLGGTGSLLTGSTYVGDGHFIQSGGTHTTGTLALTESNPAAVGSYSLDGGVLAAFMVGNRGTSGTSTFNFNGGTLQARQNSTTFLQNLTTANVQAGGVTIDTAGFDVTAAQSLLHDTTGGPEAVDGGLTKLGAGTLTLTGTNTYSGITTISAGILQVGDGGVTGTLGSGSVVNNAELVFNRADSAAVANTITGPGSVTQAGSGILTLTGASTYTGPTTVSAGTLAIGSGGSIAGGNVTVRGGTLAIRGTGSLTQNSTGRLIVDGLGPVASFTVSDMGRLSTGIVHIGSFGEGSFVQSGGSFTTNGNTLFLGYGGSNPVIIGNGSGTFTLSGGSLVTGRTQVSDNARTSSFNQNGGTHTTDVLSLTGSRTASTGIYNLNGGTLFVNLVTSGNNNTRGTSIFNFNGGTLQARQDSTTIFQDLSTAYVQAGGASIDTAGFNVTIRQDLLHDPAGYASTIDGGLTKLGVGTLTLTGTNTFNGPLNIVAGTLAVAAETNLGGRDTVTVNGSARLLFTGSATLSRTYNLGISTLSVSSGHVLTLKAARLNSGNLSGPGVFMLDDGSALTAVTALAASTLAQNSGQATMTTSTFRGTLNQTGGVLRLTDGLALGSSKLSIAGTVIANGSELQGATTIQNGGRLDVQGESLYLTGGSRTTVNTGGTLSAAVDTTIELNGSLLINHGSQTGRLNVNYGSVAKGSGSFGMVNISDGGRFSPGNSPGSASVESLSLSSGGRYEFELNSALAARGDGADFLQIGGRLSLEAGITPNRQFTIAIFSLNSENEAAPLADFDSTRSYTFALMTADSMDGFNAAEFNVDTSGFKNSLDGGYFTVAQSEDARSLLLRYNSVPEPGTAALFVVGGLLVVRRRSRRR